MTLTNDQIAAGMSTQYGRIDHDALGAMAHIIAVRHAEIRAAGIALAEEIGLGGETVEPFIQAFGRCLVESLMFMGKVPSQGYNIDLHCRPMASAILVAACNEVGLSPDLLPNDCSLQMSNFAVVLKRGSKTTDVWDATLAEPLRSLMSGLTMVRFAPSRLDLNEVCQHEVTRMQWPPRQADILLSEPGWNDIAGLLESGAIPEPLFDKPLLATSAVDFPPPDRRRTDSE